MINARNCFSLLIVLVIQMVATQAAIVEERIRYSDGETEFEGVLLYHSEVLKSETSEAAARLDDRLSPQQSGPDPIPAPETAVLMVPNWMGVTEASIEKARALIEENEAYAFDIEAERGNAVFVADMYGVDVRPQNADEAGAAAGDVRADRGMMRSRAALAMETFRAALSTVELERTVAIGFCFGGGTVLEYGRSGAEVDGIISFHGDLMSPTLEGDAGATKAVVLVLHGADDPYVPQKHVRAFVDAMQPTDVDWQLIQFSNTVHSFTDPGADSEGKADFNEVSAERAFEYMDEFLEELGD